MNAAKVSFERELTFDDRGRLAAASLEEPLIRPSRAPALSRDRGFPGRCRKLTLAGGTIAPKVSFLAPPRTQTGGHERPFMLPARASGSRLKAAVHLRAVSENQCHKLGAGQLSIVWAGNRPLSDTDFFQIDGPQAVARASAGTVLFSQRPWRNLWRRWNDWPVAGMLSS